MKLTGNAAFIGGDLRSLVAAGHIRGSGIETRLYGFSDHNSSKKNGVVDSLCCSSCAADIGELAPYIERYSNHAKLMSTLDDTLEGCDIAVLPLPFSQDGVHASMQFSDRELSLDMLISALKKHNVKLLCGGKLSAEFCDKCNAAGIPTFDYYSREEFAIANAIPTAEGAIAIAMNELSVTLDRAKALVIGYGRIGRVLADKLMALNAETVVSARKAEDFAWIRAAGLRSAATGELRELLRDFTPDVIFNTVPHCVIGRGELELINPGTLIIDLASKPGGVDIGTAGVLGHKVIWALSLPGKVAPVTSGVIIADTILGYLAEL
ncbi:MAG: dipicolinate synthase [Clostridiales bacterium]|nr:dipicolinate synthase [Clostridiales bacterium]